MSVSNSAPIIPFGVILPFAGLNVAEGWLPCDGRVYSPVLYPRLYETIGTIFGGSAQFPRLPDLRGKYPVGFDTGVNNVGQTTAATYAGTESFTLVANNIPALTFPQGATVTGRFTSAMLEFENRADCNTSTSFTNVVVGNSGATQNLGVSKAMTITATGLNAAYTAPSPAVPVSYTPTPSVVAYAGYDILYVIKAGGF